VKAAVWYNNSDIRIEEMPRPVPGPGEVLIQVISCGICGSDVVEWYRLPRAPLVLGHEVGGRVVETGESVKGFKPEDRVFAAPKVSCMTCRYCRNGYFPVCTEIQERLPGGFSEYVLVPKALVEKGLYLLPNAISYDQATFIEPLACVVRAQRLAGVEKGRSVMVVGCGVSGLLHVRLAKSKGCFVTAVDINEKRLGFAKNIGADACRRAQGLNCKTNTGDEKVDVVILCAAAVSAVELAWNCVDKGGAVVFFAVPGPDEKVVVPINKFWTREIRILTSYYCGPPDIREAMGLIETGVIQVDALITHRLPLTDIAKGFALMQAAGDSLKVIIRPNEKHPFPAG
jgi:L-iditol 2-dehydrogenase